MFSQYPPSGGAVLRFESRLNPDPVGYDDHVRLPLDHIQVETFGLADA